MDTKKVVADVPISDVAVQEPVGRFRLFPSCSFSFSFIKVIFLNHNLYLFAIEKIILITLFFVRLAKIRLYRHIYAAPSSRRTLHPNFCADFLLKIREKSLK